MTAQKRRDFGSPRFTWFSGAIIFTCSVSTVLSGIFVALALNGQRYGGYIGNSPEAKLNISAAILWTSIIAKTIELSFATCVVTLLGQVVSRKAIIASRSQGASLSELTLWRWVVQPGSMITSFEIGRYAGLSALGVLTLLSTILSTVYMTAATTLVQPVAKQSDWHDKVMMGSVRGEFVHATHIGRICQTPLYDLYGSCVDVENTGRSFSNLVEFLGRWRSIVTPDHNMSTRQEHRPTWIGLPYNGTYVAPQWVDVIETAEVSGTYNRVINNVSLAFPHIGVFSFVYDQRNVMPLSDTSDSIQPYSLWASVPSPVMKVLCVHMNRTELEPIIYDAWPNSRIVNSTTWFDLPGERDNATTVNKTVVDELFGWTKEDKTTMLDYPPVFPRYPIPFSTVLNLTGWAWGRAAIYILGQGGPAKSGEGNLTGAYPLCKLEVDITPRCSTLHSVLVSGTLAKALCDDRASNMAYSETNANATTIRGVKSWGDVGARWANSLSLGMGITYLQQVLMTLALEPKNPNLGSFQVSLNPRLPSLAETLAVMAADTILSSLYNFPFVDHWNYTGSVLDKPATQWYKAKIKSQEFASGGADNASKGWLVVLISTFLINASVLCYFIMHPGLVTDFTQPAQLFALAVNSPPTRVLARSCGDGPEGKDYELRWFIGHEEGYGYIVPESRRGSTPPVNEPGDDRVATPPTATWTARISNAVWSRLKLKTASHRREPERLGSSLDAEPLRPLPATRSGTSLRSQYELEDASPRL